MTTMVTVTINDREIKVKAGITILEAAREAGIYIPTLCDHPAVLPTGACRMCVVEVLGQRNLQSSCTFPVTDGMKIDTESKRVNGARKLIIEMIFSERNHYCPYCEMSGSCELQDMGYRYRLDHWAFPTFTKAYPLDATHKHYLMDHNRCILCGRCIRACNDLVANHTLGLGQRGSRTLVAADGNAPLGESSCISCGTCAQVCPTGALFYKRSAYMGRDALTENVKSTCNRCSVGCGTRVVTRGGNVLRVMGDWDAPVNKGLLCTMGRFDLLYDTRQRVTAPLLRSEGRLEEISWEKAIEIVAGRIGAVKASDIGVLAGSHSSNEALYLLKKLFKQELKVSNIGTITTPTPRIFSKPHGSLGDILKSDIILVAGSDPGNNQPVASFIIKRVVDKGARLIVVDDNENGLSPFAFMTVGMADIGKAIEIAGRADNPVIVYGSGVSEAAAVELKKLEDRVEFIRIESGVNTTAVAALGLDNGYDPATAKLLFVLLGEEDCRENDLLRAVPKDTFVVVQASYASPITQRAALVLPGTIWSEQSCTLTNFEGRVQKVAQAVEPVGQSKPDWEALQLLSTALGRKIAVSVDTVTTEVVESLK